MTKHFIEGYKIRNQSGIHFISFAVVQWIDLFSRKQYAEVFIDSIKHCQQHKGLVIYSWCLMSNHVHLICQSKTGDLSGTLRDLKGFSSKVLLSTIEHNDNESRRNWMLWLFRSSGKRNCKNKKYQLWEQENRPMEILPYRHHFKLQKLDYIHNNPVKAGLVDFPEDYRYSSARNYLGREGLIDIELLV